MKTWDLHTGVIRMTRSAKKLRDEWTATKEQWSDQNRRDFQQNHLDPIAPAITLMLSATQKLADILEQARRECTDDYESE
jgi:hypothetical protein